MPSGSWVGCPAFVDEGVVGSAHGEAVVEVGVAVGGWPVGVEVVGVAPFGGPVAAGEGAAAVADHDGAVLGGAEQAGGAAEVEDFAVGAHDDAADPAVAQQALHGGGQDRAAAEDVAATVGVELAGQGGGVDHDVDGVGGVDPAVAVGCRPRPASDIKRVVAALGQRPGTAGGVLRVGRFELVERGFAARPALRACRGGGPVRGHRCGRTTRRVCGARSSGSPRLSEVVGVRRPPPGRQRGLVDR